MRKKWKSTVAVFCVATMVAGTMSVGLKNFIKADGAENLAANYFEFGKSDTYLQLSKVTSQTPQAIETTVNMKKQDKEFPLFDITKFKVLYTEGNDKSIGFGKTSTGDLPGGDLDYCQFNNISFLHSANTLLNIQQQRYGINDLAISFWCYNGGENGAKLCDDENGISQMRLSSYSLDPNKNMIYYSLNKISLDSGWNHIQIPLSSFGNPSSDPQYGTFDVHNIQSFGLASYKNSFAAERRFTQFKLVVTKKDSEVDTEVKESGELFDLFDITNLEKYIPEGQGSASVGKTIQADPMGAGYSYFQFDEGTTYVASNNSNLNKTQTKYDIADLSLAFWCYNGSENTEKLSTSKIGTLQLSSNETAADHNLIRYPMNDITLQSGWNYVELPLSDWYYPYGNGETNLGEFDIHNIQSFAISGYENENGTLRKITNFKLVIKPTNTNSLFNISDFGQNGSNVHYWPDNSPSYGITTPVDPMGRGHSYIQFNNGNIVITQNHNLNKAQTEYGIEDLALSFWCYNGGESEEQLSDEQNLLLSSSNENTSANCIRYAMKDITLQSGWNYVELPLSEWKNPFKDGETTVGEFDVQNIQSFGINGYKNSKSSVRRFADFELKPLNNITVKSVNANELSGNYMIFSNTNNSNETSPYALFVTEAGYPSVVYNNKQFTLNKNIATGNDVKIAVIKDDAGYINFYIDDKFTAKSSETADELVAPSTAYCIGADGSGNQIMNGTVSNLKIYGDIEKTNCLGEWNLEGDIRHVTETVADISGNKNDLVFRGTRANDWVDYTVPTDLGDDYWSLVFVPDIQNLTNADDYNKTWQTMAKWIADNVDKEKIKHVIGAGDSTWNNNDTQYTNALNGFKLFNSKVSWSNMVGNHDYDWGKTVRDSSMYKKYFGEEAIKATAAKSTYQGYYNDPDGLSTTENSYYRFTVNGAKWMIIQLEYHPRKGAIEWANEIIKAHPLDNVILTTHGYINGWGQYIGESMNYIQNTEKGYISSTSEIWPLLSSNDNIKMILNGHACNGSGAIVEKTEKTTGGKDVPVFMINAQDADAGEGNRDGDAYFSDKPLGMLSIFRFSKDGSKVAVQYYSPSEGKSFSPVDPWGNRNSNSIEKSLTAEKCNNIVKLYSNVTAGTAPTTHLPEGYVFAGWFTDEECNTALAAGSTADNAYAKFVDADVLSVKAQLAVNDGDTSASIRFVTTVESLDLQKVGFEISNGSKMADTNKTSGTSVYKTLRAVSKDGLGETTIDYKPNEEFSPNSAYFKAFTITNISSTKFDTKFTAKAFWVTLDGTKVYGSEISRCVNDGLKKNS